MKAPVQSDPKRIAPVSGRLAGASSDIDQPRAFLRAGIGRALTAFEAGLAAMVIGCFVNGLTPCLSSVAGLTLVEILTSPGMVNSSPAFKASTPATVRASKTSET